MDPKQMVSFDLRNLSIQIKRYLEKERKDDMSHHRPHDNATHMHMLVMQYCYANRNRDIYQKDFEKAFSIRRSTATNMLKRMESHGLIERVPVPEDARLKKIMLTDKALKFGEKMGGKSAALENKLTKGLTEDELATLSSLLRKMIDNMEEEN